MTPHKQSWMTAAFHIKSRNLDWLRGGKTTGESCELPAGRRKTGIQSAPTSQRTVTQPVARPNAPGLAFTGISIVAKRPGYDATLKRRYVATRQGGETPMISSPERIALFGAEHRAYFIRDRHAKNFASNSAYYALLLCRSA